MCAAISSQLFKLNEQIKCDQAINNIEHEMFVDGEVMHESNTYMDCVAVTYTFDKALAKDFIVTNVKSLSGDIQKYEQINNAEDYHSTLKQIDQAVDFMKNCIKPENLLMFSNDNSIKNQKPVITAVSSKSLFETFVSIQYAAVVSDKITIIFDQKREYLRDIFKPIFTTIEQVKTTIRTSTSSFCTQIIFDSADFQSAFSVLATAFNDNTAPWKIRSCWIQDTLRTKFFNSFESLLTTSRLLKDGQKDELENILKKSEQYDAKVFQSKDGTATFLVGLTKKHIDSDLCVVVNFFRTPKEVVSLVQSTDNTNSISIWTESISLAYDVADKMNVENVWINSNGLLNSEIPFSFGRGEDKGIYGSKFGVTKMLNTPKKPFNGGTRPTYSSAITIPGKCNFQTTSRPSPTPYIYDNSAKEVDTELKKLIDVSGVNVFKTICFPFGQIFGN